MAPVTLLTLLAGAVADADELHLQNGSKLVGTLLSAENDTIVFDTPYAGKITVKEASVERIVTDEPTTLVMEDGRVYRDRHIDSSEGQLLARTDGEEPVVFQSADIRMINPAPWKLGDGYDWTGNFGTTFEAERGNSDSDEWDLTAGTVWRSLKDRYTIAGDLSYEESNGEKTTDNWQTRFKYDRFMKQNPKNYYGAGVRFEYDRFQDLDLRTIIGPHLGRQFFDSGLLSLQGELGPVWVDEQFDEAEDNDYPGALWALTATSGIIGFGTTLYVNHDGIFNFDATDEVILNTTIGLKMPLIFGFETGVEATYEYDGGAVEGVDDTDETYNFRIGYSW